MNTIEKPDIVDHRRRRFIRAASAGIAAAQLGANGPAEAQAATTQSANLSPIRPGSNTSFHSLKQIDAGLLNVGYAEEGPIDGPAVLRLHGWPYDIHSYVDRRVTGGVGHNLPQETPREFAEAIIDVGRY